MPCFIDLVKPSLLLLFLFVLEKTTSSLENNPYHHVYVLDKDTSYTVAWTVDWSLRQITFNVSAATTGYIGFGLSSDGTMNNADLVIGGVFRSGRPYLHDMHGARTRTGNQASLDGTQDYTLISAETNDTHTSITFSRSFDTCDGENDLVINDDSLYLLWSVGERDDPSLYHFRKRGAFNVYLLDPDFTPREIHEAVENQRRRPDFTELGDLQTWTISRTQHVPSRETTYWCSFHKLPTLETKHHAVGFHFRWESQEEYDHTHHMILFRCRAPPGQDARELFEPYVQNNTGEACYFLMREQSGGLPTQYCREVMYGYAIGARISFAPSHAGMPIGIDKDEYYLLQVHYDNPNRRDDLNYTINLDIYHTPNLRPNDMGVFTAGHQIPGSTSILIPPFSRSHTIFGHCGSMCLGEMLPPEGIKILAVVKHTHNSGTRVRLRHFRGDTELPWISNDDNYNNQFQSMRMLRNERRVLPGDHLMVQCVYDNTWHNGTVNGGLSTREEMCVVYLWYYNKVNYSICRSEIVDEDYTERWLGITGNLTWNNEVLGNTYHGRTIPQISDAREWSLRDRERLQRDHRELMQVNMCNREDGVSNRRIKIAGYPVGVTEWSVGDGDCGAQEKRKNND